MSSNSSRDAFPPDAASVRVPCVLRVVVLVALTLRLLSAPAPADASATLPEMARLEAADRLDRIQVERLARWYGTLGLAREAAEFVERRIRAGDLSREEAAPIFERIVRDGSRGGNGDALLAACDASLRNGKAGSEVLSACADGLRLDGRLDAATTLLSRIGPRNPSFPDARYAMGQIAVMRGNLRGALEIFRDLKRESAAGGREALAARAALAEADLLVMAGEPREATTGKAPAAPADDPSPRGRVVRWIRAGDTALGRAEIDEAVLAYRRSLEEATAFFSSRLPSGAGTIREMSGPPDTFRSLLDAHEVAERLVARNTTPGASPPAAEVRSLLADLLALGFFLDRADGSLPPLSSSPRAPFLSPARSDAIFGMIEQNTFGGMDIGRLLAKSGESVEVFENIAHPIRRYRSLADLEGRQATMEMLAGRAARSREALAASLNSGEHREILPVLRSLDAYLRDLDALRAAWDETGDLVRRCFDIFPRERGRETIDDAAGAAARKGMALESAGTVDLRRFVRDLEQRARSVAREREERELRSLRAVAARRSVESLVGQASRLEEKRSEDWEARFWRALGDAVAILQTEAIDREFRADSAVRIGSLVAGRLPRWERFPERVPHGPEEALIRKLIPMFDCRAGDGGCDGGALWVSSLLRWRIGDPGAAVAAREFLAKASASPMAGHVALRLGHDALRARRWREAGDAYRDAAGHGPAEVAAAARFMLGWLAFKEGDADRALRELALALPASLAARPDLRALEDDVVSLAVRCWLEAPGERLPAYGPIRDRTPLGKRIIAGLATAESRRGRMGRAAELFSAIATLYAGDGDGLTYEIRSVECLSRGGMEREALSGALDLAHRIRGRPVSGDARREARPRDGETALARLLRDLSERRFAEGMRSGRPEAMSEAAGGIEGYFELAGPGFRDGDIELRMTWAVACLRSGDRARGLRLLEEIRSGGRSGSIAARAALLHADVSIDGFRAGEIPAPTTEESLQVVFRHFPGEKAPDLAMRAAIAFLDAGDAARAARAAAAVEGSGKATPGMRAEARLVHARALLASGDVSGARLKAAEVLATPPGASDSDVRTHARDVFLLATRKDAAAKAAAGDRIAAAALLEELPARFPDLPDAADRLLDALSYYRDASDAEAALRTGSAFLRLFPDRIECLDVAATIGPLLEERGRGTEAARLYARTSDLFPQDEKGRRFLFRAARLAEEEGDWEGAQRWYAAYAGRYGKPRGVAADAVLSAGLLAWRGKNSPEAIRAIEKGLRLAESASGAEAPPGLDERVDRARIAVGDYWAGRFRQIRLVEPLDRSLARKQRCFRSALAAYDAASRSASLDVRMEASRSSGDLFVEFGRAILDSQRPRGMEAGEREIYESALSARSRKYVERALEDYSAALEHLKEEGMPADLAEPFQQRVAAASRMLATPPEAGVRK